MNFLKKIEDYDKDICNLTKQEYFGKLKNDFPDDEEIERTNNIIQTFNNKN